MSFLDPTKKCLSCNYEDFQVYVVDSQEIKSCIIYIHLHNMLYVYLNVSNAFNDISITYIK